MNGVSRLALRNLVYYWRTNLAVVVGVAIAVAVLSGALFVGESVRASLRDLVTQRLGRADVVVGADRFFREELATALWTADQPVRAESCPLIRVPGVIARAGAGRKTRDVQVYGVDERFWRFHGVAPPDSSDPGSALISRALGEALGISAGEDVLVRLDSADAVPRDLLFAQRETGGRAIRFRCAGIVPADRMGDFALQAGQGDVLSVFVPLRSLQRDLRQRGRANTILVSMPSGPVDLAHVRSALRGAVTAADLGIRVRVDGPAGSAVVETDRILLDDALGRAAERAATDVGRTASGVFTYLVNTIRGGGREIPYSTLAAADLGKGALANVHFLDAGTPPAGLAPDNAIWLNEWAWKALRIRTGDSVDIEFYRWEDGGHLSTGRASFTLAGVVALGDAIGTSLAPSVPGVSDAANMRTWEPPFPIDLRRIQASDEDYWRRCRATPKAFVTLATGQRLWRSRFGQLTSVRVAETPRPGSEGVSPAGPGGDLAGALLTRIVAQLDPERMGFVVASVRAENLEAARGSTDFGEYFLYFSFFLIVSAVLLTALFFTLGVEQRVRTIGVLEAVGYAPRTIRRLFLVEGIILAGLGGALGSGGAVLYGWLLVAGLRTWWVGAVGTSALSLHTSAGDLGIGVAAGLVASIAAVLWALRSVRVSTTPARLNGVVDPRGSRPRRVGRILMGVGAGAVGAAVLLAGTLAGFIPSAAGFFGAGALVLASLLGAGSAYLRWITSRATPRGRGWPLLRLSLESVAYRPGRSVLCVALVAMATFVVVSVGAFRKDDSSIAAGRASGTGGYALVGQSVAPVVTDPRTTEGLEALGLSGQDRPELSSVRITPFRVRPGDDASCLNLYAARQPRIVGAPGGFLAEGRFSFQGSLAETPEEKGNPWRLLEKPIADGSIPAIADANTIEYSLHRSVGDTFTVPGDDGRAVRLTLVGALRDSILQGEVVVAESAFLKTFPTREGYRFFLMDAPAARLTETASVIEEQAASWGVRVERAADRLAAYRRVENTYLATFQSLGLLGLMLGTAGLAVVLLRNVLERRRELAMLRAIGFTPVRLAAMTVLENVTLVMAGLAAGSGSAWIATAPALATRGLAPAAGSTGLLFVLVLGVGLLSSLAAVVVVVRMPVLASLRSE